MPSLPLCKWVYQRRMGEYKPEFRSIRRNKTELIFLPNSGGEAYFNVYSRNEWHLLFIGR